MGTKKGGARKGKPKGSRLAYDDTSQERSERRRKRDILDKHTANYGGIVDLVFMIKENGITESTLDKMMQIITGDPVYRFYSGEDFFPDLSRLEKKK
jgi:hypothetical protein